MGQQTSIANEIRRNLRNYSDAQVIAELLQNADDAKASRVAFLLDERQHGTAALGVLGPNVASLQGPALLQFDDAVFREENFDGLFAFGVGSKRGDPTQTGRFGLGFNAVYHLTECPMLVSGTQLLVLDPQRRYVAGVDNAARAPGLSLAFADEPRGSLDDVFDAFRSDEGVFDCDMARQRHYPGTLFRFPLRTAAQAGASELRPETCTVGQVRAMLDAFAAAGSECALFLQHVRKAGGTMLRQ